MSIKLPLILFAACISFPGCAEKENKFSNYVDLKTARVLDEKTIAALPRSATNISVSVNPELNTTRIEYSTTGPGLFLAPRMISVSPQLRRDAIRIFPLLESRQIEKIFYRCNRRTLKPDMEGNATLSFYEVEFTGRDKTGNFYWNTRNPLAYDKFCSPQLTDQN